MIRSMTAFARKEAQGDWGHLAWECRSVNSRYLDLTVRLPESLRDLEMKIRDQVKQQVSRGKLECVLRFHPGPALVGEYALNKPLMKQLHQASEAVAEVFNTRKDVSSLDVLRWPDMLQEGESDLTEVQTEVMNLLQASLQEFLQVREREGAAMQDYMLQCLTNMRQQVINAEARVSVVLAEQKQRLLDRIADLKQDPDTQRLEQEMIYWAQKLDITEELQRLTTHVNEVESVLKKGGVAGRRLDFLMQELNREANTLGSKSADVETTQVSVELKVLIEQMREQVQNIE